MRQFLKLLFTSGWVCLVSLASWGQIPPLPQSSGSLAYVEYENDTSANIFLLDMASGVRKKLTDKPLPYISGLDWSPDGRQLALSVKGGGRSDIYVMDADGRHMTAITRSGISYSPAWSPDGTQIIYVAEANAGVAQLYVINADGTKLRNLTKDDFTRHGFPDWSPDGSQIVFVSQPVGGGKSADIYLMDADGKNRRRLAGTEHLDWAPAWSPDGRRILFASMGGFIHIVDANGVNVRRFAQSAFSPVWSPDGKEIAFVSYRDRQIYLLNVESSDVRQVITDQTPKGWLSWTAKRPLGVSPKWNLRQTIWGWIKARRVP